MMYKELKNEFIYFIGIVSTVSLIMAVIGQNLPSLHVCNVTHVGSNQQYSFIKLAENILIKNGFSASEINNWKNSDARITAILNSEKCRKCCKKCNTGMPILNCPIYDSCWICWHKKCKKKGWHPHLCQRLNIQLLNRNDFDNELLKDGCGADLINELRKIYKNVDNLKYNGCILDKHFGKRKTKHVFRTCGCANLSFEPDDDSNDSDYSDMDDDPSDFDDFDDFSTDNSDTESKDENVGMTRSGKSYKTITIEESDKDDNDDWLNMSIDINKAEKKKKCQKKVKRNVIDDETDDEEPLNNIDRTAQKRKMDKNNKGEVPHKNKKVRENPVCINLISDDE